MATTHRDEQTLEELARERSRRLRRLFTASVLVIGATLLVSFALTLDRSEGEQGSLTEVLYEWPGPVPPFTDVTAAWGLETWRNTADFEASGGVAVADVNRDGRTDLVVSGGDAVLYLGGEDGFEAEPVLAPDTVSTGVADLDGDGRLDILLGRERGSDLVFWGDSLFGPERSVTELDSGDPTTGLVAADFDGDGSIDILRLGYGGERAALDIVWLQMTPRAFEAVELPDSRRRSLAAAVADFDGVAGLDIWVTRDIGWRTGGDSLYVRSGNGEWVDRAPDYGTAMEIDGMGVTVADFTGDMQLDVYLSDLGDNELLRSLAPIPDPRRVTYAKERDRGVGRIRAPGADSNIVSSSWGSGVADLNLDGYLDLVVANGGFPNSDVDNKIPGTSVAVADPPSIFLGLPGAFLRWADIWSDLGLGWEGAGRGLALGDLDGDFDTDIVVSTRDAGLRVLRNDTEGSSVAVSVGPGCDPTGVFVTVLTASGPRSLPVAAPTFLGRHGPEFIIGTGGDAVTVPGRTGLAEHVLDGSGRESLELACAEVGPSARR